MSTASLTRINDPDRRASVRESDRVLATLSLTSSEQVGISLSTSSTTYRGHVARLIDRVFR